MAENLDPGGDSRASVVTNVFVTTKNVFVTTKNAFVTTKNAFRNKDMTKYILDMVWAQRDVETLWAMRSVNTYSYRACWQNRNQYFRNYWMLVRQMKTSSLYMGIVADSIVDLFLEDLQLAPHPPDVHLLVEDDRFNRINSRETLTWPVCLDEIVPDNLPNGNGMTYRINREGVLRSTVQSITDWMKNNLYIDLDAWYAGINFTDAFDKDLNIWGRIDEELDDFFEHLVNSRNIVAPDVWKAEYERYSLNPLNPGSANITNLLNKIRHIHNFLDTLQTAQAYFYSGRGYSYV